MNHPKLLSHVLLLAGLSFLQMPGANGQEQRPKSRWVRGLASPNAAEADQAALKVFQEGRYDLGALIVLLDNDQPFGGQMLFYDSESSFRGPPTVSYVAMYLIHAILSERLYGESPTPYLRTKKDNKEIQEDDLLRAKAAYRSWWHRTAGRTPGDHPLAESEFFWGG